LIGVSPNTYRKIEEGECSLKHMILLSQYLGMFHTIKGIFSPHTPVEDHMVAMGHIKIRKRGFKKKQPLKESS
jgi:hypothetical protein